LKRKNKTKKINYKKKIMKGGLLDLEKLQNEGFTQEQIQIFNDFNIPLDDILKKVTIIKNQTTQPFVSDIIFIEIINEKLFENKNNEFTGGSGIGCNHIDPNYSIYNTRLTQLFPYKSNLV
jgi:hypothetical protein